MDPIFKYNRSPRYLTKYLRGGYNGNDFLLLDVYQSDKGLSVKIKLPNIFEDNCVAVNLGTTEVNYDEWAL